MPLTSITQKRLFLLGSIIVLFLSVLLYIRIYALMQSFRRVDHTNKIELKLEYTLSFLKDAETGQRGFLLTHDSSFLQPYIGSRKRVDSMLTEIKALTKDNPKQQLNCGDLKTLIDRRFFLMDNTLQKSQEPLDSLRFSLDLGKFNMNRIREHINYMKAIEQDQLKKRESTKNYYEKLTPLSLSFLVFSIVVILAFSYYGLTKQLQQTRSYASDLDFLNKELVLRNKQLENSVEELNSFNYIASHDLKEPLRKILFFTDAITTQAHDLPDDVRQHLNKINAASERMKGLLDDLLTYVQASMGEHNIETVDLNALLDDVKENLSDVLQEKKATLVYNDLPSIQAIPSQMQQLFENLITNSIKYSRNGVPPEITISSNLVPKQVLPPAFEATHDHYHQIRFSDNGIGFTQDNAEKIFVLFQRLHQRHEFSGTGIGLTICKKIVQNHNGFITAESAVDRGTTFFIYLPA